MLIEFVGGILANSIAIMTDAAHLLSDLFGFIISIVALNISKNPPDNFFSYGYYRAEIVGALGSVALIWILTVLLICESIGRIFDSHHRINGEVMLITSTIGLIFNGVMAYILHSSEEGHHCNHNHNDISTIFTHNDILMNHKMKSSREYQDQTPLRKNYSIDKHSSQICKRYIPNFEYATSSPQGRKFSEKLKRNFSKFKHAVILEEEENNYENKEKLQKIDLKQQDQVPTSNFVLKENKTQKLSDNVNIKAAFIHILGDILQSIGVIIAAIIVFFFPDYHIVDPLMTMVFGGIVFYTTISIVKECFHVIMEGRPSDFDINFLREGILHIKGVEKIKCLHVWCLSLDKISIQIKVVSNDEVLHNIRSYIHENFACFHLNVEVQRNDIKYPDNDKV